MGLAHVTPALAQKMMHFVALFTTVSVLIMFLASKQQRPNDRYGLVCTVLFTLLAVIGTLTLHGTVFFSASAFALALLLCVHHIITSFNHNGLPSTNAEDESAHRHHALFRREGCPYHETWITAALVAGTVSMLRL